MVARVEHLVAGYGTRAVVNSVDIEIGSGEIVALIGHNGAGKSTLVKAMFGLLPVWSGKVVFARAPGATNPSTLLRAGIVYAPQGNQVFPNLTVRENLEVAASAFRSRARRRIVENSVAMYPMLSDRARRRARTLSGGERQQLGLASVFSLEPHLLLLDEPSAGLAPALARDVFDTIVKACRSNRIGALVVEQKVRHILSFADRVYVMRRGCISYSGSAAGLDTGKLRDVFL